MNLLYDRNGDEIDINTWIKLYSDQEYVVVDQIQFNEIWISTVWLGIAHGYAASGKPIIFETMIFGGTPNYFSRRYTTLEGARRGHRLMVIGAICSLGHVDYDC